MTPADETCARCGRSVSGEDALTIDGETVCRRCLHGDARPLAMYPIGYVRNGLSRDASSFGTTGDRELSRIELLDSMAEFMRGIGEERHLTVVFVLHRARPIKSVFNRGIDGKATGMFAARTPDRINPIGITDVELDRLEGTTLYVRGLDAIDGSPVLDIKLGHSAFGRKGEGS